MTVITVVVVVTESGFDFLILSNFHEGLMGSTDYRIVFDISCAHIFCT